MRIFDSHCHLHDQSYDQDLDQVIERARKADVLAMMTIGIDNPTSIKAVNLAQTHDNIYAAVGVHPHDARNCNETLLNNLRTLAVDPKVKAWGETGLDFNRMYSPRPDQEHCFIRQLEIGADLNLPMIFHERDSQGRFLELLMTRWHADRRGVVHCFSGSETDLKVYLNMGLYIGITGVLTIQSRGHDLRRIMVDIPADRLLVETDAPYLTPTPQRNKYRRNEPAFVRTVLMKLAQVRGENPEELAEIVWRNTCRLFNLEKASVSDP